MFAGRGYDPREAFEVLPEAVVLADPGGAAVAANAAARALFGLRERLPPGGAALAALGPLATRLAELLSSASSGASDLADEAGDRVLEAQLAPVRSEDGELLLTIVLLIDVSSVRRATRKLEALRQELSERVRSQADELHALAERLERERADIARRGRQLLAIEEVAGIGHWVWRAARGEMEFSPGAARLLGVPERLRLDAGTALQMDRVAASDRAAVQSQFARICAGEPVGELRFAAGTLPDGTPRRFLATPPVFQGEERGVHNALGLIQDITAHECAAAELQRLNSELESGVEAGTRDLAEVARTLEGFAYMATHDLRAPLRAVNGGAAIALEEYGERLDPASRAELGEIARLANRLDGLIDELRALAAHAGSAGTRAQVDLAPLTRRAAREFAPRGVRLRCPESLPLVADPACVQGLWRQLLARLCEQAERERARAPSAVLVEVAGEGLRIRSEVSVPGLRSDALLLELLRRSGLELLEVSGEAPGASCMLLRPAAGEGAAP